MTSHEDPLRERAQQRQLAGDDTAAYNTGKVLRILARLPVVSANAH